VALASHISRSKQEPALAWLEKASASAQRLDGLHMSQGRSLATLPCVDDPRSRTLLRRPELTNLATYAYSIRWGLHHKRAVPCRSDAM